MRMQVDDELSHIKAEVDYSQIPPIQQKRIIAFVNHFVTNTVSYLNNFCQSCESRFMEFEYKVQKIEASLLILEAQLSSIPGFDTQKSINENGTKLHDNSTECHQHQTQPHVPIQAEVQTSSIDGIAQTTPKAEVDSNVLPGIKASEHPTFAKFFKMVRVGVKEQAVRLKMQSEGVDPAILDKPDAIIQDSGENS